jgi:pyruvate/2-oxoglutarate dehydrogenase complex dihydrolipoamide acyltransferase (E2) component
VGDDHPDAVALLAKVQAAQNQVSALAQDKSSSQEAVKAAREALLQLKEEYHKLTGHNPKLEIVKKDKPAAAPAAAATATAGEGGEAISKRCTGWGGGGSCEAVPSLAWQHMV